MGAKNRKSWSDGPFPYETPQKKTYHTVKIPVGCGEFTPAQWRMYNAECVKMSGFFADAFYPVESIKLPNGIITLDLKRYVNVQLQQLRFHFKKRNEDHFIYTYDLLIKIIELPIWKN